MAARVVCALSGVVHALLALAAVRMAAGGAARLAEGESERGWTAEVMARPYGRWGVGVVGAVVVGFAVGQVWKAWNGRVGERLELGRKAGVAAPKRTWAERVGRVGVASRGVVFGVIGVFLVVAAVRSDPGEAVGLGGALDALRAQAYGAWVLGVVAVGLVAYGVYMWVESGWRRIGEG